MIYDVRRIKMRQLEMKMPRWGGKRPRAGRPRVLPGKPRLKHLPRQAIPERLPVHVVLRMAPEVGTLRTRVALKVIGRAVWSAQDKFGMRLIHFTVESNHLHLIVEGVSGAAMKGLGVRIARGINRLRGRSGRVIGDRYFARGLRTPAEVRNAVRYVVRNHARQTGVDVPDEYSSAGQPQLVVAPRSW